MSARFFVLIWEYGCRRLRGGAMSADEAVMITRAQFMSVAGTAMITPRPLMITCGGGMSTGAYFNECRPSYPYFDHECLIKRDSFGASCLGSITST